MKAEGARFRPTIMGTSRPPGRDGFTLLELVVAFSILALFILPMLEIVHQSHIRAIRTSVRRQVQEMAQKILFERIYDFSEEAVAAGTMEPLHGTFEVEVIGAKGNRQKIYYDWDIPYPQMVNQGDQPLLEYTIRVYAPERATGGLASSQGGVDPATGESQSEFEMTTWTFPSAAWYLEQQELISQGIDTGYYGGLYGY